VSDALFALARLAVALWTGAVAAVAFVVAPRVFSFLENREWAGDLMAPIFRRIDIFGIVAAALFAVAARKSRRRFVLAAALGAAAAVNAFALSPLIRARGENFEFYHRASEALWGAILVGGTILALAGARPRTP
jgi:hypothetical protein